VVFWWTSNGTSLGNTQKMIVTKFNTTQGISIFEECYLKTQFHAHPATEIIIAKAGNFSLTTKEKQLTNLQIGLILPNVLHSFNGDQAICEIILLEKEFVADDKVLLALGVTNKKQGIISLPANLKEKIPHLLQTLSQDNYQARFDKRIEQTIQFIKEHYTQSDLSLANLSQLVHLSPSRLSHLFKAQMGISIQKFIVWIRMKAATDYMLNQNMHLTQAAYSAGFYDTAHFSKHFKDIFGIKPSLVYNNSCIVQDS